MFQCAACSRFMRREALICPKCSRNYHPACMAVSTGATMPPDWSCPSCETKKESKQIPIKKEKTDDPFYLPLSDENISNVIKEEFEEEDTVLQNLDSKNKVTKTDLLPDALKLDEEGSQSCTDTEYTEIKDTSKTKAIACENNHTSPSKSDTPEMVIFPLTMAGHLQVKTNGGKQTPASTAVWILNTPKPGTRATKRPVKRLKPVTQSEDEDDEEILEPTKRSRKKKQYNVQLWNKCNSSMKTFQFTRSKSWLMPQTSEPVDYFNYFYDDKYLQEIADETNKEAINKKYHRYDSVYLRSWTDVTTSEIKIFLGLLLHTGTAKMTHLGDYWRQHRLYKSCFRDYMTPQRFTAIMRYLTIPDCADDCDGLSDRFNTIMDKIYYPGRNLNLDSTILDWSLKSMHGQYNPSMDKTNLTKITTLCEQDGTIINP